VQGPKLVVLEMTESFGAVWAALAESAGAVAERVGSLADVGPADETCALVVSCAGVESGVAGIVGDAAAAGASRVAVVGAAADHRIAVNAVRAGAAEYFALPADLEALRAWVLESADLWRNVRQAARLASETRKSYNFSKLVGGSAELRAAIERAVRIIPRPDTTVLLLGETGTGKELLAQAIHYNGPRAASPFVEVNCAALPPTLLESELFGHEKGAFTDARAAKPGLFEAAHGGTLFLDEIGDLQPDLQVKLLKVLEDRKVRRLGSVRVVEVDIRIIAATSVDLPRAVSAGRFREDLYYRLSVVPIELPPLRRRGDDVIELAHHFVASFGAAYDMSGLALDAAAERAVREHDWPGNVRELRNAIERAVLLGDGVIRVEDLFVARPPGGGRPEAGPLPFPAQLEEIERAAAKAMLDRHDGNKSGAAEALGISRSRLYRLLD
jgi:DNA-binding NtrC family response regulator